MRRKLLILIVILLIPSWVSALEYPKLNSKVVEVYDYTDNKVLYEVDSNKKSSIASLTKIATTITAIENIKNLDEEVVISREILNTVSWDASVAGLKVGDIVTYRDLLYASILPSGADATNAIAILSSGSIDNYVKKMNELVNKIGLKNTHFVNVTGFDDDNHYSTADDCRKLLEYALKNKLFRDVYSTNKYTLSNGLVVKSTIYKYNKKGVDTSKIIGSKTGYTGNAGYCFSSLSNLNGHEFITIVLDAEKSGDNLLDTISLLDFIADNYRKELLIKKDEIIKKIPIKLSNIDYYEIKTESDIEKFLPSDYNKNDFKTKYTGLKELSYKNNKGDKIGKIKYYFGDELFFEEDVILDIDINFSIKKFITVYWYIVVIFVLIVFLFIVKKLFRKKHKKMKK